MPDLRGLAELPDNTVIRYDGTVQGLTSAPTSIVLADGSVLAKISSAARAYCAAISWSEITERTLIKLTEMLGGNITKR